MTDPACFALSNGAPRRIRKLTAVDRRAIDGDRAWFASNPARTARLRNPIAGEAEAMARATGRELPAHRHGCPLRILVVVVGDGLRWRLPLWTVFDHSAPEALCVSMAMLIQTSNRADGGFGVGDLGEFLGIDKPTVH